MAKQLFFNYPTVDLLGNLQSSKNSVKAIKSDEIPYYVAFFGGYPIYADTLEKLKQFVSSSSLSNEIKNNVANLTSKTWEDINVAFLRPKTSVSPIYFKNDKQEYVFIFDIVYRDWYKKEYDSTDDAFLKAAARPISTPDKPYSWFQNDWLNSSLLAETELLRGNFIFEGRLGFSKFTLGGYVKHQRNNYNYQVAIYKGLKEQAQKGDKTLRQDFGAVFNLPNDPDPALPGPQTQTISGVTNKAPVVDNPNIKLPSQEVKGLDANAAQQAATQAQGTASNVASQAQNAVGGLTSQAQGAASQAQGTLEGAVGQAQGALGNAQQSAGGVLSNLSSGVKGALGGGALGAGIGALAGGGKGALIGAGAGVLAGGIAGSVVDKLNPKGIKPDGLGKDWSPDKVSPESFAGNDKYVDPKTGMIGSTSKLAAGLKGGLLGGGLGAGIGALAGGGKGALIGGLSGTALGAGLSIGGVTGGALAGGGLGAGIGGLVGGGKGAVIGAVTGGAVGAAAAKLASVQKGLPKPKIPKPVNTPRIKTIKIPKPPDVKGTTDLLNLPNSSLV